MADKNKELNDRLDALQSIVEDQTAIIADLQKSEEPVVAQAAKTVETPKEPFKVDGKAYVFTVPRYIDGSGKLVLSEDSLQNPSEQERLVSIKSGVIKATE